MFNEQGSDMWERADDITRENVSDALRSNERENDEDPEDIQLGYAIRDVAGNMDVLSATIARALTRDQISRLINRLNKTLDL